MVGWQREHILGAPYEAEAKEEGLKKTEIVPVPLGQLILFFKHLWILKGLHGDHWPGLL